MCATCWAPRTNRLITRRQILKPMNTSFGILQMNHRRQTVHINQSINHPSHESLCELNCAHASLCDDLGSFEIIWSFMKLFKNIRYNMRRGKPFEVVWCYVDLFDAIRNHQNKCVLELFHLLFEIGFRTERFQIHRNKKTHRIETGQRGQHRVTLHCMYKRPS